MRLGRIAAWALAAMAAPGLAACGGPGGSGPPPAGPPARRRVPGGGRHAHRARAGPAPPRAARSSPAIRCSTATTTSCRRRRVPPPGDRRVDALGVRGAGHRVVPGARCLAAAPAWEPLRLMAPRRVVNRVVDFACPAAPVNAVRKRRVECALRRWRYCRRRSAGVHLEFRLCSAADVGGTASRNQQAEQRSGRSGSPWLFHKSQGRRKW
jgi:hypothetical protein